MLYICLFVFIAYLAYLYDVIGYKKNKLFTFRFVLLCLALISGLRYRLGADTIVYEYYYNKTPDLWHLTFPFLRDNAFEPLWVILNSFCKTIYPHFFLVQLVVSSFHIFTWGWFVRKVYPSGLFMMLLFFYMFEFTHIDMVLMREAVAMSFFFILVVCLNEKKYLKMLLCIFMSALFHKFSVVIAVMIITTYFSYRKYPKTTFVIAIILVFYFIINLEMLQMEAASYLLGSDTIYTQKLTAYVTNEKTSVSNLNWKGYLGVYLSALIYLYLLFKTKGRGTNIEEKLFTSIIIIAIVIASVRGAFPAFYRLYDYFQTFTSLLAVIFFIGIYRNIKLKTLLPIIFLATILVPTYFCYRIYSSSWGGNQSKGIYGYMEFYPYSSVLFPERDDTRERSILNYAFD